MSLEFCASMRDRGFEMELTVEEGETIAILGPNGAGKSTLLQLIAGLLKPDSGRATLNDRMLFDVMPSGRERWLAPHERGISLLAQDALLFPHLNAIDNVAFGPRSAGASRSDARDRARTWLDRVEATDLAGRKPAQLSGGQAQRVAVARALASEPALLLLDEPMAALDVSVAPAMRRMLRHVLHGRTAIIVTHDVLDAFTLADRVVVLDDGRIVDVGPTRTVLDRPATPFAAELAALNLLVGIPAGGGVLTDSGHRVTTSSTRPAAASARIGVAVRPTDVTVRVREPEAHRTGENVLAGMVTDLELRGDVIRVRSAELAADLHPRTVAELNLEPGMRVWFSFAEEDAIAYPL
ncbi:molybdate transport system ATP-binding protein [Mycetocola sp. CAN_C7]|uniref:sulfate/molybdate ABC transporter ATP-binding protein n=1 Tax=Mycetocola sp. CAN_C7 TaxID=2787724 RepID=UPI0018CBC8E7